MGSLKQHRRKVGAALRQSGADSLLDEEIYMALLSFCLREDRAWELRGLALRLKSVFGGFAGLPKVTCEELGRIMGMDADTARFMRLVGELARRAVEARERSLSVASPEAAGKLLTERLGGCAYEVTAALCLDENLRCLCFKPLAEGDAVSADLDVYEVASQVFSSGASAVILGHNHPEGSADPSEGDMAVTKGIMDALRDLSVPVLDHITVSGSAYTSLAELGFFDGEGEPVRAEYCSASGRAKEGG